MSFLNKLVVIGALVVGLMGCKGMTDDLQPSNVDKRVSTTASTPTNQASLSLSTTEGNTLALPDLAFGKRAAVLYFTMWCPICASHTDHMINHIIPQHPAVDYYLVDYVSGDVSRAKSSQVSSGYGNAPFQVLVDENQQVLDRYQGGMGVVVVLDSSGDVLMNEEFKDGSKLTALLATL